jgi:hypothetical protein
MSAEDEELVVDDSGTEPGVSESQVTEESQGSDSQKVDYTEFEKKQYERAKKAEAELKEAKAKAKALEDELKKARAIESKPTNAQPNPEEFAKEVRLLATLTDDEIAEVKDIAKGKGIPLEEATKTKSFLAFQKQLRDEERKEKARLGASKGSDQENQTNEFDTGVTPEGNKKHLEAWKKAVGR